MRIVYIILAHKLPEQLVRLVRKLQTDAATFLIHIDKKTDEVTFKKMEKSLGNFDNVHFLKRHVCYWGAFGHVAATLEGIRKIITLELDYDYVTLLTGQDYPIKSNDYIQKVLRNSDKRSFIEYFPLPSEVWGKEDGGLERINYWYFHWLGCTFVFLRNYRFNSPLLKRIYSAINATIPLKRTFPKGFNIFGGSSYWCLSRDCIDYIHEFVQKNDRFVKFFKHVNISDEIMFHTILLNSPLKSRLINDNLRYIEWSSRPNPMILRKKDFSKFFNSDKLFARKFDMTIDNEVLDMIDQATSNIKFMSHEQPKIKDPHKNRY
jgi:hypothetical protein